MGDGAEAIDGIVIAFHARQGQVGAGDSDGQIMTIVNHHDPHGGQVGLEGVGRDDRALDVRTIGPRGDVSRLAQAQVRHHRRVFHVDFQMLSSGLGEEGGIHLGSAGRIIIRQQQHAGVVVRLGNRLGGRVVARTERAVVLHENVQIVIGGAGEHQVQLTGRLVPGGAEVLEIFQVHHTVTVEISGNLLEASQGQCRRCGLLTAERVGHEAGVLPNIVQVGVDNL